MKGKITHIKGYRLTLLSLVLILPFFFAFNTQRTNYDVKFSYIKNFAIFTKWPQHHQKNKTNFVIKTWDKNPFRMVSPELINSKKVNNRSVKISRIKSLEKVQGADVIFFPKDAEFTSEQIQAIHKKGIITIGEVPDFYKKGGIINFYLENKKIRFEINRTALKKNGFVINSKLLKLAKIVGE